MAASAAAVSDDDRLSALTPRERRVLSAYSALSLAGQRAVDALLATLPKRQDKPERPRATLAALALKSSRIVAVAAALLG